MNVKGNSLGASVLAGVVVGLVLSAQLCSAVQVDTVRGPVLKFQDGADTVVYIPSNATIHVSGEGKFDMLVVGGGGGGGLGGGGGGGGAVVYKQNLEVVEGDYDIVVGQGGAGGYRDFEAKKWMASCNGGESSAFDIKAPGGGAGGSYGANQNGDVGSSGGGAAIGYFSTDGLRWIEGSAGTEGLGYAGGASTNVANRSSSVVGGGGGGAGSPGTDGRYGTMTYHNDTRSTATGIAGGVGGDGLPCSIWGDKYYGGGGGGARADGGLFGEERVCLGGRGGGGAAGYRTGGVSYPGEAGVDGTGGGGGASGAPGSADGFADCPPGSAGGSGVVILRYRTSIAEHYHPIAQIS